MTYYLLIPLLLSIIIVILLINCNSHKKSLEKIATEKINLENLKKEELKEYFKKEWDEEQTKLSNLIRTKRADIENESTKLESNFKIQKTKLESELSTLDATLKEKEKRYDEVNQDLETYRKGKIAEIDGAAAEYEQRKCLLVDASIVKYRDLQIEYANNKMALTKEEIDRATEKLAKILKELEEERIKRAAINEEILRARALEEQQDFYRIQLDPNDKDDVEILRSVAPRLRHPEAINKVIWSAYYQKPLAELRKRVAIEGSGIYKITRLKTGEIYIGQAVNISDRWTNHCKSALGIGNLASSQLHRVMREDGPEQFTWEVLEETPKEKLKERESYYIDFYDSKTYGLNTIRGEQK